MIVVFDIAVGLLILVSAILATIRGLTREVLSLVTWGSSALFAWWFYLNFRDVARGYIDSAIIADILTVVVAFVVALMILHLLTMWIADIVVNSRVGALDRSLGFIFGGLRGILIAVVAVIFGQFLLPVPMETWGKQSKTLPVLVTFGHDLIDILPQDIAGMVNETIRSDAPPRPVDPDLGTDALELDQVGETTT